MSEKKKIEPGVHFYTDSYTVKSFEREKFQSLCASRAHAALRMAAPRLPTKSRWMVSVSGLWGVEITLGPDAGGPLPTRVEEHKILRWLKKTLDLPKTAVFKREFNEYSGGFTWKYYEYNFYKAPGGEEFSIPLTVTVVNTNHNCKLVEKEVPSIRWEAVCKDDQSELEFG
jgi:hypothetical protein